MSLPLRTVRLLLLVLAGAAALFAVLSLDAALRVGFDQALQVALTAAAVTALLVLLQPQILRALARRARRIPAAVASRSVVVLTAAGVLTAFGLYAASAVLLRGGPSVPGYAALSAANLAAVWTAVGSAAVQVGLVVAGAGRVRRRVLALAGLAAATAVPVLALVLLGGALVDLHPLDQPLDVESMLLAVLGTGRELLVVPAVFAAAAATLPLAHRLRR